MDKLVGKNPWKLLYWSEPAAQPATTTNPSPIVKEQHCMAWKKGRGKLGVFEPLLGDWIARADSDHGPGRVHAPVQQDPGRQVHRAPHDLGTQRTAPTTNWPSSASVRTRTSMSGRSLRTASRVPGPDRRGKRSAGTGVRLRVPDAGRPGPPGLLAAPGSRLRLGGRVAREEGLEPLRGASLHTITELSRAEPLRARESPPMEPRLNHLGQPIGPALPDWMPPPFPPHVQRLHGRYCRVEPLDAERHAEGLYAANALDRDGRNWTYMTYGPFPIRSRATVQWVVEARHRPPTRSSSRSSAALGSTSRWAWPVTLRIAPEAGAVEVGHLLFSEALKRSPVATEAMSLLMQQRLRARVTDATSGSATR
jgi:hypothetical protein